MGTSPRSAARMRLVPAPVFMAAALFGLSPVEAPIRSVHVTVGEQVVRLKASSATVADALAVAGVRPRIGVMRSVVTSSPLDLDVKPGEVMRAGRPVQMNAALEDGDSLALIDGADWTEPTVVKRVVRHGSPLPAVEKVLWRQSHDGVVEQVTGEFSGEVVTETVLEAPVAAAASGGREVVLTFDDGPDPRWTPHVLDILRDRGAKAVFCVVGTQMRRYPDLVRRIHAEGHVLCNHTENHDVRLREKSEAVIRARVDSVTALLVELTGERPRFYRAPGGVLSDFIIAHVRSEGMRVLDWTIDPMDYRKPGAEVILERIATTVSPGAVVLMHDAGGDRTQTVAQVPALIDRLRADTYTITVP